MTIGNKYIVTFLNGDVMTLKIYGSLNPAFMMGQDDNNSEYSFPISSVLFAQKWIS